jgi:hypothetical protein
MATILDIKLGYPLATADPMAINQWAAVMGLLGPTINDKRKLAIPDDATFQNKVVDPSAAGYAATFTTIVPNPRTGKTQQMILDNHHLNLFDAFGKWTQKLDSAFETVGSVPAKKFIDAVNAAKNLWGAGAGARTLRATGARLSGVGASVIAPYWMTAHKKANSVIRVGTDEVVIGSPLDIIIPGMENAFVTLLTGQLTFAMIQAEKSGLNAAVLTSINDRLNAMVNAMLNPGPGYSVFATAGPSFLNIINDPVKGEMLELVVDLS